jgi:hypothetical protein
MTVVNRTRGDQSGDINTAIMAATDEVHFSGGVYYHSEPIVVAKDGLKLSGNGVTRWRKQGAFDKTSAAIFVYTGDQSLPGWYISGEGVSLEGLNIWGGFYGNGYRGTGIEWSDWGRWDISHCTFHGWDLAWKWVSSNHCDCSTARNIGCTSRRFLVSDENQAAGWNITGLYVNGEATADDILFDLPGMGGNLSIDTLVLNETRSLFRAVTSKNSCTFDIRNLKIDNNAAGWRLGTFDGPLNLIARGHIGAQATPGPEPLIKSPGGIADVKLFYKGQFWTGI